MLPQIQTLYGVDNFGQDRFKDVTRRLKSNENKDRMDWSSPLSSAQNSRVNITVNSRVDSQVSSAFMPMRELRKSYNQMQSDSKRLLSEPNMNPIMSDA